MTQQEILDYNKRCAEFLGFKYRNSKKAWGKYPLNNNSFLSLKGWLSMDRLQFHSDWNWIMEVKDAIQRKFYFVDILGCGICTIKGIEGKTKNPHISAASDEPKEAVVQAFNEFLIWYNK